MQQKCCVLVSTWGLNIVSNIVTSTLIDFKNVAVSGLLFHYVIIPALFVNIFY